MKIEEQTRIISSNYGEVRKGLPENIIQVIMMRGLLLTVGAQLKIL